MSLSTTDLKKTMRREALERRDAISPETRHALSAEIARAGADAIAIEPGTVVSGFWPIRSEIDVRLLMHALGDRGARLALPAILDKTTIAFREYDPDGELVEMGWGTTGPREDAAVLDPEIMLVPMAAFDNAGNRIGYGAGHFDRAITKLHERGLAPTLIGVAFAAQETDAIPAEPHDVPLNAVLTEKGLRSFAAGA